MPRFLLRLALVVFVGANDDVEMIQTKIDNGTERSVVQRVVDEVMQESFGGDTLTNTTKTTPSSDDEPNDVGLDVGLDDDLIAVFGLLAAGMSDHSTHLKELPAGWSAGTAIVDISNASLKMLDTAQIYKFRNDTKCAIVFSATDDAIDAMQQMMGTQSPQNVCGFPDVNGGYAQELTGYMQASEWKSGIEELSACGEVYAVGHSMGGAMASLFAACANTNAEFSYKAAFGSLPEVSLVTFGAPSVAKTALYNGEEGSCFKGVRQYVSSPSKSLPKEFQIGYLKIFQMLCQVAGQTEMKQSLGGLIAMLEDGTLPYPSEKARQTLLQTNIKIGSGAVPGWLVIFAIMSDLNLPGLKVTDEQKTQIKTTVGKLVYAYAKPIAYLYDPVPQLFTGFGYKHPLLATAPQKRTGSFGQADPAAGAECTAATSLPEYDYAQLFFGLFLKNSLAAFPNHGICCLLDIENCEDKFKPSVSCPDSWGPMPTPKP